jgi:hypothetical protein
MINNVDGSVSWEPGQVRGLITIRPGVSNDYEPANRAGKREGQRLTEEWYRISRFSDGFNARETESRRYGPADSRRGRDNPQVG